MIPLIILVVFLFAISIMSFLSCGDLKCTQYQYCDKTKLLSCRKVLFHLALNLPDDTQLLHSSSCYMVSHEFLTHFEIIPSPLSWASPVSATLSMRLAQFRFSSPHIYWHWNILAAFFLPRSVLCGPSGMLQRYLPFNYLKGLSIIIILRFKCPQEI